MTELQAVFGVLYCLTFQVILKTTFCFANKDKKRNVIK